MTSTLRPAPRVVLYGRNGCHLCAEARVVVADVCAQSGVEWVEIDVDSEQSIVDRYGEFVPLVMVDGVQQGFWRVDGSRLRAAIDRGATKELG